MASILSSVPPQQQYWTWQQHKIMKNAALHATGNNWCAVYAQVECLALHSRSERKIIDRVLKTNKTFAVAVLVKRNFLHGRRPLRRMVRVGSSSCGLKNMPLVPELCLPLLRHHFVCDLVPIAPTLNKLPISPRLQARSIADT